MKENESFDYGMAWVLSAVVTFFYFILGSVFMVMSGTFNIALILIYSAVSSFLVVGWIFRDNASEAQIGSGMIFIVSSIIFLHTSAPIWGEEYYCQAQYSYTGNNTYSFNKYGELTEGQDLGSNYEYCMSQGGFSYMMKRGEAQPTLLKLSSIATAISLLILIGSSVGQLNFNSSSAKKARKPKKNKGVALLEIELLECELIVADYRKTKKLSKSFYTRLMKLSDMLFYFSYFQTDFEYDERERRIDSLQHFASKKAAETFKGDNKKIAQVKEDLSYTAGQGGYFLNQHDKWWKKHLPKSKQ
jgi:hypothetical protein